MSYPLSLTYSLLLIFLISIALVQATGGALGENTVVAGLTTNLRTPDGGRIGNARLAVPPVGLSGFVFNEPRKYVKFTISPPGVRCFLRKAIPGEGEGEETPTASSARGFGKQGNDGQSEPTSGRHLSPVFGKVISEDNLSSSFDIRARDQLWQRILCFQTDGSEIKILLEFEGGDFELINIRSNRSGWVSKEIDRLPFSQRDILRSTIVQAPNEDVECAITGKSVFAFLRKPLNPLKLEKTLYKKYPGGKYTYILCRGVRL